MMNPGEQIGRQQRLAQMMQQRQPPQAPSQNWGPPIQTGNGPTPMQGMPTPMRPPVQAMGGTPMVGGPTPMGQPMQGGYQPHPLQSTQPPWTGQNPMAFLAKRVMGMGGG